MKEIACNEILLILLAWLFLFSSLSSNLAYFLLTFFLFCELFLTAGSILFDLDTIIKIIIKYKN
jgi:hypothetical protein